MNDATYVGPPLVKEGVTLDTGDRIEVIHETDDGRFLAKREGVEFWLTDRSVSQDDPDDETYYVNADGALTVYSVEEDGTVNTPE